MKLKKMLSLLLTLIMALNMLPITVLAESTDSITYIKRSWNGTKVVESEEPCTSYELLHNSNSSWYYIGQDGETTWYVAQGNITMNGTTLSVRGNVNIILCDDADVTIKDGIEVKNGNSLTIYGQKKGTGKLYAKNNDKDAGIGCGPNSGIGEITIHGGVIEAHGGKYGAGIGSGDGRQMNSRIIIYGGDIKAYGGAYGAGIGSGDETGGTDGDIVIYGGKVYAKGGTDGAGIGGGNEGNSRNITIWGGVIEAHAGSNQASGIGGGDDGGGGNITINGGDISAYSTDRGPGIGGDSNCGTIIINDGEVYAESTYGAGIGGACDENPEKGSITINGGNVTARCTGTNYSDGNSTGIGSGGNIDLTSSGDLRIPITITGGQVYAFGIKGSAGIGAGNGGNVTGQITITGGHVDASSSGSGAGIGSGAEGNFGVGGEVEKKIIISGGTVIASSAEALAIGHGKDGSDKGVELYEAAKVTAGNSSEDKNLQTADKRSYGMTRHFAMIEPCKHEDLITYTKIDDSKHKKICGACGNESEEQHSSPDCVCGHHNPQQTVTLNSLEGITIIPVYKNTNIILPFQEGQIITDGNGNYLRVNGWQKSGDNNAPVSKPGILMLVTDDISLDAVGDNVYGIRFDEKMQNGSISTDQTIGDLTGAAADEKVSLDVSPNYGYRISKVSYTICAGENPLLNPDTLQPVEVEIPLTEGKYQFKMPDVHSINVLANTLLISAEFEELSKFPITCTDSTNGTISTGDITSAYEGEKVRVNVIENEGYEASVFVNGTKIEPTENGEYYFTMPGEAVTLTATFTPVEYTIKYELNGGDNNSDNPLKYTVESETFTFKAPTKEGYEFLGWYYDEFFKNPVTEIQQGSTGEITLYAKYVSSWSLLKDEINNAEENAVITLHRDYYAEHNDEALTISKKLTIELNGHTLDANEKAIRIFEIQNGDLTITGNGTITGGDAGNSVGGAIMVRAGGTLTLNGGQITNCTASNGGAIALTTGTSLFTMNGGTISNNSASFGGGVHVQQGKFVMNGGSILNNSASKDGGGLYATQNADITIAGGSIEQNTAEKGNVYLNSVGMKVSGNLNIESVYLTDQIITVAGTLSEDAEIGLTYSNNPGNNGTTLTSGLNGNGTLENFISAKDGYLTGLNADGEIVLGKPVTVSFDSNGGSEVESQTIPKNSIAVEPTAPTFLGHIFNGWYLNDEAYDFSTPVAEDLTLIAQYSETPTCTISFSAGDGGGTMESVIVNINDEYTLPECGFNVPEGKKFAGWLIGDDTEPKGAGYKITVTEDITLTAKWEDMPATPEYETQSLVLSGQIGANFYMDLDCLTEEQLTDSYMEFTINDKTQRADFDPNQMNQDKLYYGFTCKVNSVQMADTITAVYHYKDAEGNDKTVEKKYTVEDYLESVTEEAYGTKAFNLIKAINDYGYYAQQYLSANAKTPWTLGTDHKQMTTVYTESYNYSVQDLAKYAIQRDLKTTDIEKVTYSLSLDADTAINLYIKPVDGYNGKVTIKLGNKELKAVETDDNRYKVTIPGISAHLLGNMYEVKITTASGESTVKVSALSYAYAVMEMNNNESQVKAMSALYDYYKKAIEYRGQ